MCLSIPNVDYDEDDILKFVEPFGKVTKFFLHQIRRECFIEMSRSEEAESVTAYYRTHPLLFHGKRLTTYVSRKYRELRGSFVKPFLLVSFSRHVTKADDKRASKREKSPKTKPSDEPPAKKTRQEEEEERGEEGEEGEREEGEKKAEGEKEDVEEKEEGDEKAEETSKEPDEEEEAKAEGDEEREEEEEQREEASEEERHEASEDLTEEREEQEQVKMGYYCRVCSLFYSNEDAAKRSHCSSREHYDRLQVRDAQLLCSENTGSRFQ
uniref:Matrin-type domain-containing protein n=1 Tax=Neogobius melanostomus TaxID=47308 RepID=A0A8C6SNF3_9GOBI